MGLAGGAFFFSLLLVQIPVGMAFDRWGARATVATVSAGATLSVAVFAALAALSKPPLGLTVALLMAIPFLSSYSIVIVAQGRSLFPDRLAGRGVTTVNMAQLVGATLLPALAGYLVSEIAGTAVGAVAPEQAYRAVFGMLAVGSLAGLAVYLRSKDSRPAT